VHGQTETESIAADVGRSVAKGKGRRKRDQLGDKEEEAKKDGWTKRTRRTSFPPRLPFRLSQLPIPKKKISLILPRQTLVLSLRFFRM
jgi:hypothetical protein